MVGATSHNHAFRSASERVSTILNILGWITGTSHKLKAQFFQIASSGSPKTVCSLVFYSLETFCLKWLRLNAISAPISRKADG
jgi:hypothetical protein